MFLRTVVVSFAFALAGPLLAVGLYLVFFGG